MQLDWIMIKRGQAPHKTAKDREREREKSVKKPPRKNREAEKQAHNRRHIGKPYRTES